MLRDDSVVVLVGKRCTGKSWLVRNIMYNHKTIPIGTVISGTESANSFYSEMVPPIFIHNEYSEKITKGVLKRQKMVLNKMKDDFKEKGGTNIDPRAFLILDDCLYDNSWVRSKNVRSLFMNGRHYKMLFIITMQYSLGIPPNLRTNVDFVFILRENIYQNRKRLYDSYAGMFPSFDMFCQVMDQCTENFACLVIHNNAKSNKLEDQVFWYKAPKTPSFQIGSQTFWNYHKNNYSEYIDDDEDNRVYKKNKIVVSKTY